jgi:hypothetical protein
LAQLARELVETSKEISSVAEHARSRAPLTAQARHLLAKALETSSSTQIVAHLARIDPAAVSAFADEVQRHWVLDPPSGSRDAGER